MTQLKIRAERAMSILSPVSWESKVGNHIKDREHVLHVTSDSLTPGSDVRSNTSNLRITLDNTQILHMESWALRRSVSPLSTPSGVVKTTPFSSRFATSKSEWENHRAQILQFYVHEDKTLREIMQLMQEKHAFKATEKMYKSRLRSWNARKYLTKSERDAASQIILARERSGEPCGRVIVRGKDRKLDVFLRHMGQSRVRARRRKVLEHGDPSQDIVIDDITSLQCPLFLPPLMYPAGLEILCRELPQLILKMPGEAHSCELFYAVKQACLGDPSPTEIKTALDLASEWFRKYIKTRPSLALMSLLGSQTIPVHDEFYSTKFFKCFYRHLFDLTKILQGSQNPLTKLLFYVLQVSNEPRTMQLIFQYVVTETIAVLQKHNSSETYKWQELLAIKLQKTGGRVRARTLLMDAVSSFGKDDIYNDKSKWKCMLTLARHYVFHDSDKDEEAEHILRDLLQASKDAITKKVNPWHANYVFNGLGQLAEKRGEIEAAVDFYRLRTEGAAEYWGENCALTLHALENLARLLRYLKREEEAVVLEKRIRLKDELGGAGFA